ncbi:MAG: RpsU-divergently transcribed [Novosphingobium sp. 17-62-19]|uniref:COQ9 family protein n=1 Tax=Novosphingobium sp. 17-62-19 TaxID=1970406 RepID=UPI000BDB2C13|nr:COQ9 family protein [Novosphingobium sp. 17-62-19]OZA17205.1 MAG: RpsU-divergently transcribed [Novosphingobium sp. 17-62-19]OZA72556.1 MAG: RpsU-divergently transcribed [Sphingomonadales bacterium 39-62-4]HQS97296.1 COQ9 family protein [Novosphingobium sp.]
MTDNTSLEALRLSLAPAIAEAAAFDGWKGEAVTAAAEMEGVDPALAAFAFEGGAMQMISAWIARIDADMADALPASQIGNLPIRERIRRLVQFRLDALIGKEEALRRALAIMAMPQNVPAAARLGWSSADAMWRLAGDTATDYNHYTKRMTLGSIYAATLAYFAQDTSDGHEDTRAFLDRRIDNVMQFEKAKAKLLKPRDENFSLMRMLGRLRYPAV